MTDFISHFIPTAFPALALAHFLALVSPGPDFFLIVGHAVRHRLRGSGFICLGIALGNAAYIALAIAGWSAIKQSPWLYRFMELAGAAYLVWLGVMLLRSSRLSFKLNLKEVASLPWPRQLLRGLGSSLLNPKNAIFYLTLMTVILGPGVTFPQQVFSGLWMTLVVLIWDLALAAAISHPKVQRLMAKYIPHIEGAAGIVLIVMAVLLIFYY